MQKSLAQFASNALLEAMQLVESAEVKPLAVLNTVALAKHPGGAIELTRLDAHDRFVYRVDLRDKSGQQWELDIDAASGEVLKNMEEAPGLQ